jgi:transcriptional regulator with XRE-family HTH domain
MCSLSQREFAAKHGFSLPAIANLESGLYTQVSDAQILAMGKECYERGVDAASELSANYGVSKLQDAYLNWQKSERLENADRINQVQPLHWSKEAGPFKTWREQISPSLSGFAKLLKVPGITVERYETGSTRSMPAAIETALREIQFPWVREMIETQTAWADEHA